MKNNTNNSTKYVYHYVQLITSAVVSEFTHRYSNTVATPIHTEA